MDDGTYIKRLKERIRQKPDSRVFLSLAEELRKHDRIDDAIAILIDGIKKNPEYTAARLTLGRWYLANSMFMEAEKEFLEIIAKTPGNIFARKGLAEAYRNLGLPDSAAEEYGRVLEIDPLDDDAVSYLESMPEVESLEPDTGETVPDESARELLSPPSGEVSEIMIPEMESMEEEPSAEERKEGPSGLSAFRASELPHFRDSKASDLLAEAESFIAGGHYGKALDIYNTILSNRQNDMKVLQMKKELIALIELTGQDKEIIISRLNRFSHLLRDRFAARREDNKKAAVDRLCRLLDTIKQKYTHGLPENF